MADTWVREFLACCEHDFQFFARVFAVKLRFLSEETMHHG